MAEVFAIATAAASGLEQCIRLCERVQTAVERQKDLPQLIKKHSADISRTKAMVELVESEKALGTPNVRDAIERVVAVGDDLKKHLSKMASTKRRCFWGFLKQFISGQKYQDALDTIMRELGDSKNDLSMHIQLANVGLTRGVGEQVMVSVATVESVNRQLQEKLGSGHNLRIHNLLEGRPRNGEPSRPPSCVFTPTNK
ncbi:hypothetical protein B0H67DRAFT_308190 [Lasiosphaeris hirsuta]|uniref:Uncharacterized protein n=1 Tax=Lasiosphaeris hirsuta TaxID=260670 RepID=A0AA40A138_9PEZI|nr:hypothetical protein B0H67DRAFT_308190 [Lasiosphaeris hirsuta]